MNELRDFQKTIFDKLTKSKEHISLLDLPCGCGKGEIYCHYAQLFDKVIIVSPLKQHVEQNIKRLRSYLPNHKVITFDSDYYYNMFDIDLHNIICSNNKCVIGITYCAIERNIISFSDIKDLSSLIICDEVHNITKYDNMYKSLFSKFSKVLLASATPNKLNLEFIEDKDTDIYYLSVGEAIERKYITDYNMYIPIITEFDKDNIIYDSDFETKVKFMQHTINKSKCKRIVVYLSSINECNEFIDCCKSHISENFWYNTISCHVDMDERKTILREFQNNDSEVSILCSIHILDECIDIPKCDGVFLIKINHDADIRIVQRVFRSIRLDPQNSNKIASIMLWCEDIDMACNILNVLKEKDNRYCFNDKIKMIGDYYSNDSDCSSARAEFLMYLDTMSYNENQLWNDKFIKLCEISYESEGLPARNDVYENINIGSWVHSQKMLYSKNMLPTKRRNILLSNRYFKEWTDIYKIKTINKNDKKEKKNYIINKSAYNHKDYFKEMFKLFDEECDKIDGMIVYNHVVNDISIGSWLNTQKMKYKNNSLSDEQTSLLLSNKYFTEWSENYKTNTVKSNQFTKYEEFKELLKSCNNDFVKLWVEYPDMKKQLQKWKVYVRENKCSEELSEVLLSNDTLKKYFDNKIQLDIEKGSNKKRKYSSVTVPNKKQRTLENDTDDCIIIEDVKTKSPDDIRNNSRKAMQKWYSNPANREKFNVIQHLYSKTDYAMALHTINRYRKLKQDPTSAMIKKYKLVKMENGKWTTQIPKVDRKQLKLSL